MRKTATTKAAARSRAGAPGLVRQVSLGKGNHRYDVYLRQAEMTI
jgi:hypothetical protein